MHLIICIRYYTVPGNSPYNQLALASSYKFLIPQPQFHRIGTVASATPKLAELNHCRCQMASEHSLEDQNLVTQEHIPPTSREESTQLETTLNNELNLVQEGGWKKHAYKKRIIKKITS